MGGDHGHGSHPPYKIPDYRVFKIEDCPKLIAVQKKLAAKGLSDPWLRNEAWRYNTKVWPTKGKQVMLIFSRGFIPGVVFFGLTLAYEAYARPYDHHDH